MHRDEHRSYRAAMRLISMAGLIGLVYALPGCAGGAAKPGFIEWDHEATVIEDRQMAGREAEAGDEGSPAASGTGGRSVTTRHRLRATNDGQAAGGLTMIADSLRASTGASQAPDAAIGQLASLPWLGALLLVGGIGTLAARAWVPVMPVTASIAAIGGGVALIALPVLIDRMAGWVLLSLIAGGVVLLYSVGALDNVIARIRTRVRGPNGEADE